MLDLASILAWYGFLIAILCALQRVTKCFTQINIFSLCIGLFLLRHGVTVPFDHTVNQWYAGIDISPEAHQRFYSALVIMWLGLFAGAWVGRKLFGAGVLNEDAFCSDVRLARLSSGMHTPLFLCIVVGGVSLVVLYQLQTDVSFIELLSGKLTSGDYRAMRESFGAATHYSLSAGQRLATIVRFGLFPFFIGILYFMAKRGLAWRALFGFVLLLGIVVGFLSGQKAAPVISLAGVAIAIYLADGRLRLRLTDWRIWANVGLAWLVVFPYLYRLQYPDQDYAWLLRATTYRLTSEHNRGLQLYFQIYPDVYPHLYGQSSGLMNSLLGVPMPVDMLPERLIPIYYLGPDYLNTWNTSFVGVAWADFGHIGVGIESIMVGMLLQFYAAWFRRSRKTALVMGTQVGLIIASTRLSEVALSANLLTFGLLSGFLLFALLQAAPAVRRSLVEQSVTGQAFGRAF